MTKEKLNRLTTYFENRDYKNLVTFFKTETIEDENLLVNNECYEFYKEIHNHNLDSMIVNFTCIYVPKIDTSVYGYKDVSDILKQKQQEEAFTIEIYLPKNEVTELRIRTMITFANYLNMSFYMSVADYKKFKRNTSNLYGVSSIVLDLDTYNTEYQDYTDEELLSAMQPIIDRIGIEPNMFINSGNGKYIVFSFNNVNLSISSMRKLYTETVQKLIHHFKSFGADSKCSDITRVFRVVGNVNPKTERQAYIIKSFHSRTTLSELATAVGICKGKDVEDKTLKSKNRTFQMFYKSIFNSKYSNVNKQRNEDFLKLLELRNYDMEGYRNIFFHLMSINCFYMGMNEQEVTYYLNEVNRQLIAPYEELESVISYAKRNYEVYLTNEEKAIKYKNRDIVVMLDISEVEQKHMQQLIGQQEADSRQKEFNKSQDEYRKLDTKEKQENSIKELLFFRFHKLMDNKQIATTCKIDERTVNKLLGYTPKFVWVGQVNKKKAVYFYCLKNMTNQQIAEKLNINLRTVQRMKHQLRKDGLI